ncbi:hypothetical protein EV121DRAFT_209765, partial [Schizophyllum commune]
VDIDAAGCMNTHVILSIFINGFPNRLLVKVGAAQYRSLQVPRLAQASIESAYPWMMGFGAAVRQKA